MDKLRVVKIGGNIVDDDQKLQDVLDSFHQLKGNKILVHGGGKLATRLAGELGIKQTILDGRRVTDGETLKVVVMVYAGLVNKKIVGKLQALGTDAVGLTGADGGLIEAHKRIHPKIDYGFVGDIDRVNSAFIKTLIGVGKCIVVAPITSDESGSLLNTNADTIAQEVAKAMTQEFDVDLIYSFEKEGVLLDVEDDASVISTVDRKYYKKLKEEKKIFEGMIPKLDNAFEAIDKGVKRVIIGKADHLDLLIEGKSGTNIE